MLVNAILLALACSQFTVATYSVAGDSWYPHNYIYDLTLQNEQLSLENKQLKQQMLKLDHKQACLDARSYHHTLVNATATSTIRDLNSTAEQLSNRLLAEWTRNNHLTEQNYNLSVSTNALLRKNRNLTDTNTVLSTENIRCRTNEQSLADTVDALQQQVQTLFQENNFYQIRSSSAEQENRNLLTSLQVEQQAHRLLRDQHDFLQQTNNEFAVNNQDLSTTNAYLHATNTQLNHTNQKVQALVDLLEPQVPGLSTKNIELTERNHTISSQNHFLESRGNLLERTVSDLRKEVAKLNDWVLRLQRASREEPFSQNYHVPSNTLP